MKMHFYGDPLPSREFAYPSQEEGRTRIVVPIAVSNTILDVLRQLFINSAGGCTESDAIGWWHNYEGGRYASEPVKCFDVAGLPVVSLQRAADIILHAGQTDVYVELASGQCAWFTRD